MNTPIIKIKRAAYDKMWNYIMACDTEISGIGHAYLPRERDIESRSQDIIIEDIYLLPQRCSGSSTVLTIDGRHKFLHQKTIEKDFRIFNVYWHSHVNMSAYYSGIDENEMNRFMNPPWMIYIVGNKHMEYKMRMTIYKPIKIDIDDCKFEIIDSRSKMPDDILNDIKKMVTTNKQYYDDESDVVIGMEVKFLANENDESLSKGNITAINDEKITIYCKCKEYIVDRIGIYPILDTVNVEDEEIILC